VRKNSREYWIDPESGISRSDFDLMYQDLVVLTEKSESILLAILSPL
jgi:hypothetical protein